MTNKQQLNNFLRINGLSSDSSEEEVRAALVSARWATNEVKVALTVLRGEQGGESIQMITTRKIFRSNSKTKPKVLSKLLGVTVDVDDGCCLTRFWSRVTSQKRPQVEEPLLEGREMQAV